MSISAGPFMLGNLIYNYDQHVIPWVADRIPGMEGKSFGPGETAIGIIGIDGRIGGGVVYSFFFDHADGGDISASMVIEPGCRITRQMWRHLYGYAFHQLGCLRISCQTDQSNHVTRKHLKRVGFVLEGKKRCGRGHHDVMMYGLLKSDCRFL